MFGRKIEDKEVTKVISALTEAVDFLIGTPEKHWQRTLTDIKN